jgi:membrane-associated phospholipid phosphatase
MPWVSTITNLGDAALLLPGSLALCLVLIGQGHRRAAEAWLLTGGIVIALTVVTKVGFYGCGVRQSSWDLISPSGHTSFSAIFYGSCAVLAANGRSQYQRVLIHAGAVLLVGLIGISRVLMEAHTWPEVMVGAVLGGGGVALFGHLLSNDDVRPVRLRVLAASLAAAAVLLQDQHLSAEPLIRQIASSLHAWSGSC